MNNQTQKLLDAPMIDLGIQLLGQPFSLIISMAILQDGEREVCVQLHPAEERYQTSGN